MRVRTRQIILFSYFNNKKKIHNNIEHKIEHERYGQKKIRHHTRNNFSILQEKKIKDSTQ